MRNALIKAQNQGIIIISDHYPNCLQRYFTWIHNSNVYSGWNKYNISKFKNQYGVFCNMHIMIAVMERLS